MSNLRSFLVDKYYEKNDKDRQACACRIFPTRHVGLLYISTKAFLAKDKFAD
jgi:hypothetical protein